MGGHLTVTSQEHCGSTFTFVLPYKISPKREQSDDPDELSDMDDHESVFDTSTDDMNCGFFHFEPRTLGSLFSSGGSTRTQKLSPSHIGYNTLNKLNVLSEDSYCFPSNNSTSRETASIEDACSVADAAETLSEPESSRQDLDPDNRNAVGKGKKCQAVANVYFQSSYTDSPHLRQTCIEVSEMATTSKFDDTCQRQEHKKSDRSFQRTSSSSAEPSNSTLKPKILLVEDNKINVMVTQSMMKQFGHSIDVVNNGVEAVRAVQHHRYDLILMVIFSIS